MRKQATIADLIAKAGGELTPTERSIARAILKEPTLLAFGTVSDLASRVGTSRPSVVRFAHKLGLKGYTQLQHRARNEVSQQLTKPSERIRRAEKSDDVLRATIDTAIDSVFKLTDTHKLAAFAKPIVRAKNIWIISGETSRAGAHVLRSGLSMVRPNVRLLDIQTLGTDLSDVGKRDVAIAFDFFRYRRLVNTATQILSDANVSIIAITDSPLSPLVELADDWCEIKVPAVGPFDSSLPAVALAELLVSRVAKELKQDATKRIDQIESLWEKTQVFL